MGTGVLEGRSIGMRKYGIGDIGWSAYCTNWEPFSLTTGLVVEPTILPLTGGEVGTEGSKNFGSLSSSSAKESNS